MRSARCGCCQPTSRMPTRRGCRGDYQRRDVHYEWPGTGASVADVGLAETPRTYLLARLAQHVRNVLLPLGAISRLRAPLAERMKSELEINPCLVHIVVGCRPGSRVWRGDRRDQRRNGQQIRVRGRRKFCRRQRLNPGDEVHHGHGLFLEGARPNRLSQVPLCRQGLYPTGTAG